MSKHKRSRLNPRLPAKIRCIYGIRVRRKAPHGAFPDCTGSTIAIEPLRYPVIPIFRAGNSGTFPNLSRAAYHIAA